jgi:hypothetical protein
MVVLLKEKKTIHIAKTNKKRLENWAKTRNERGPLIGRPMRVQSAQNKSGTRTSPGVTGKKCHYF